MKYYITSYTYMIKSVKTSMTKNNNFNYLANN